MKQIVAQNRRARFNYEIIDTFETGIVLTGTEIKSIRANQVSISEAYVVERNQELQLVNAHIPEYEQGNQFNHVPTRNRKLLAHKSEIRKMAIAISRNGLTLVPLKMYFKGRWMKVEVGVCKGRAKADKRAVSAKKEAQKEMDRALRQTHR